MSRHRTPAQKLRKTKSCIRDLSKRLVAAANPPPLGMGLSYLEDVNHAALAAGLFTYVTSSTIKNLGDALDDISVLPEGPMRQLVQVLVPSLIGRQEIHNKKNPNQTRRRLLLEGLATDMVEGEKLLGAPCRGLQNMTMFHRTSTTPPPMPHTYTPMRRH